MYRMSQSRRSAHREGAASQVPSGESPMMLHWLRQSCSEELRDIVTYLHDALDAEEEFPAVGALFATLAKNEIEHYKALCRLMRVLGEPFHLQARLQIPPTGRSGERNGQMIALLQKRTAAERMSEASYRRLADAAGSIHTRKLMLALAAEEAGHAEALSAMAERLEHS